MKKNNTNRLISGQRLLADFQTAFISVATVEAAKHEAKHSEDSITSYLKFASSGRLLNPATLVDDSQNQLTRASLDAHIKKVQAQQMATISGVQLQQLMAQDQSLYYGRKVRVHIVSQKGPVESIWLDKRTGYRKGIIKRGGVNGVIEEVLLDQNVLVLRPSSTLRLFNPSLQNYLVYIIDPENLRPMVQLSIT